MRQYARQTGAEVIVTRAFQHTGPGHIGAYAMADWARQLAEIERSGGSGVIRCGNIDVERDYLDVRDVASAYARGRHRAARRAQAYNVCSQVPRTHAVPARGPDRGLRRRRDDRGRPGAVAPRRPAGRSTATASALSADTGWEPSIPIERTLADLAEDRRTTSIASR